MPDLSPSERLARNLLPIARIAGQHVRWNMDERLAHHACPGVSVAVMKDGELAWSAGYGHIEAGKPETVKADTMFSGASISKPAAAVLALQLVERGVLNLDVDVNRYLKSWQVPDNEFTRKHPVTLRLLLCHKAGTTLHGFGAYKPEPPYPTALDILSKRVVFREDRITNGVTVDKVPGGTTRYSGGGTTVVQQLLEDVTGKPFHRLARENIFEPLGMTRTTFEAPLPERYRGNTAVGHEDGAILPEKFVYVPAIAAGAIYTTAADYARFMLGCRDAWLGKPKAILGRSVAQEMMTQQGDGEFGLGWELLGEGANRRFGHGGSNAGYQCESTCYLEKGDGAVVMTNADSGLVFYWEIFNGVADMYGWQDFMLPEKRVQPIPQSDFPRYAGVYDIVSGVDAPEMRIWVLDGKLKSQVPGMRGGPRDLLMDQNGRFFSQTGPYETAVTYDDAGNAFEMAVLRDGKTEIMRARRRKSA
ncbi:MAG: serine hydrolase domain-containing protein [Rhizomicrobium sp.]